MEKIAKTVAESGGMKMNREQMALAAMKKAPSAMRAARWALGALRATGWAPGTLKELDAELAAVPKIVKPYTRLLADIKEKRRIHEQLTFGPDDDPKINLCSTPMCTAGHLVNMAGEQGYKLRHKYGFPIAAALIANKAHPGWPQQNYGNIPQAWALAFIEEMAEREASEAP